MELMNLAGYDVAAPGNHEFDYGYPNLKTLAGEADFPILAANVRYDNAAALGDQTTFTTTDGKKIGIFGLDTPETATRPTRTRSRGSPPPTHQRCSTAPRPVRWTPDRRLRLHHLPGPPGH
ncbi:MAG: hypothetical protein ACLT9P_06455 [Evtepia gabavorous]